MNVKMKRYGSVLAVLMILFALKVEAQTQRVMLVEEFTNVGCVPCAMQNPAFDALLAANADKVAVVKYHPNWPSATDPMYPFDAEGNDARTAFYNVTAVPAAIVDGNRYFSVPSGLTQSIFDQLLAIPSPFEMQMNFKVDSLYNKLYISIEGQMLASAVGDLRLFVAVIEREIRYEVAPGSNGEKDFRHVLRQFITDPSGLSLGDMESGQQFAVDYDSEIAIQAPDNLSALAWIQNHNTKEVYQACKCDAMATAISETNHSDLTVYPNPTEGVVNIVGDGQRVTLYNMVGQCVFEGGGEASLQVDMTRYGSGVYVARIGNQTRKIIVK